MTLKIKPYKCSFKRRYAYKIIFDNGWEVPVTGEELKQISEDIFEVAKMLGIEMNLLDYFQFCRYKDNLDPLWETYNFDKCNKCSTKFVCWSEV